MKIAISSTGQDMNSQIDPRFGRCAWFMVVQTDDMSFEVFENEFKSMGGGAGIQAANFIHSKDAAVVLTGNCGPNAMNVFSECNIKVITGQESVIRDVIEKFINGELSPSVQPTVNEKAGLADHMGQGGNNMQGMGRCQGGSGRGMGRGQGGGCGMGRGMGSGRGMGRR